MAVTVEGIPYDPLSTNQTEPRMTSHDVVCVHTMAGTFGGTESMFEDDGFSGTDSTFGLRGDGYAEQWQDLLYQTDANLDGNAYVLSIECEDMGSLFPSWSGSNVPAFTDAQVDKLVYLIDKLCDPYTHRNCPSGWRCRTEGIPRVLIPDTKPGRRGIGYHRQGIDPWRVSGGVKWSNNAGKVCPGDRRINQLLNVIIPRVAGGNDLDAKQNQMLVDIEKRSTAVYKALRNDDDADQALVRGIREHVRWVLNDASTESGSDLREMVATKTKDSLEQYDVAKVSDLSNHTPENPTE